MNMQDVSNLVISEGNVRTIHDSSNNQLWGKVAYDTKYKGDTTQQAYSGFQLLKNKGLATSSSDGTFWSSLSTDLSLQDLGNGWARFTSGSNSAKNFFIQRTGGFDWKVSSEYTVILEIKKSPSAGGVIITQTNNSSDPFASLSTGVSASYNFNGVDTVFVFKGTTKSSLTGVGLRTFFNASFASGTSVDLRLTIIKGDHVSDYQNYIGGNYEPYVGAIPSPNPDYPQTVNVVTGTQTLTLGDGVNSDDYTLSLGSVELCKIGSYQDYIYKSGNDWYVHKECGKVVLNGTSEGTWTYNSSAGHERFIVNYSPIALQTPYASDTPKIQWSNYFTGSNGYHTYTGDLDNIISGHNNNHQIVIRATQFTSSDAFKNWLSGHNVTVYYVLATSTDTKITDPTLISQLDNIHQFLTRYGYTSLVSGNLPIIIDRIVI